VKHIAAGEGGMITTNNRKFYEQLKRLRTHGITKDPELLEQNHGEWYYEMIELGYNYRLTDIQAALGLSQLKKADQGLKQRQMIAEAYDKSLEDISEISLPFRDENIFHAFHLYVIQTEKRKALYDYLRENSIYTQVHYIPVHLHPYYRDQGWKKGDFPVAEKYYSRCLSLPMYPSLSTDEQQYVIKKIRTFFGYE
jgi:dTDP-4-amino-4,6-dideoxygalactose transaminase